MQQAAILQSIHPVGESGFGQLGELWPVDTPGERWERFISSYWIDDLPQDGHRSHEPVSWPS